MPNRILNLLLLGVLALTLACADSEAAGRDEQPSAPPVEVSTALVEKKPVEVWQDYPASFKPSREADVRARVEGQLESALAVEGQFVQEGQPIFLLDPRPYQATVNSARAQLVQAQGRLAQAQAGVTQAQSQTQRARNQVNQQRASAELERVRQNLRAQQREVERFRPLVASGAIPQQRFDQLLDQRAIAQAEFDALKAGLTNTRVSDQADLSSSAANLEAARADVEAARGSVATAQAELERAQLNLSYTRIEAPFTGVIGIRGVDPGSLVIPGQTRISTISQADPILVDFTLSEAEFITLKKNQSLEHLSFRLTLADGSEYQEKGQFALVDRNLNQETGTILLRASFPNPSQLLKPGGSGQVTILKESYAEALVVPDKALSTFQSLDVVYVVNDKDTVEQREVVLGPRLEGEVVISSGLQEGDRVVTKGLQKVRPGSPVQVAGTV